MITMKNHMIAGILKAGPAFEALGAAIKRKVVPDMPFIPPPPPKQNKGGTTMKRPKHDECPCCGRGWVCDCNVVLAMVEPVCYQAKAAGGEPIDVVCVWRCRTCGFETAPERVAVAPGQEAAPGPDVVQYEEVAAIV